MFEHIHAFKNDQALNCIILLRFNLMSIEITKI